MELVQEIIQKHQRKNKFTADLVLGALELNKLIVKYLTEKYKGKTFFINSLSQYYITVSDIVIEPNIYIKETNNYYVSLIGTTIFECPNNKVNHFSVWENDKVRVEVTVDDEKGTIDFSDYNKIKLLDDEELKVFMDRFDSERDRCDKTGKRVGDSDEVKFILNGEVKLGVAVGYDKGLFDIVYEVDGTINHIFLPSSEIENIKI